jgi:hypothetical protein
MPAFPKPEISMETKSLTRPLDTPLRRRGSVRVLLAIALSALCAAPTPGDVGGCGQTPRALDAAAFFAQKDAIDCEQCIDCGHTSDFCVRACSGEPSQNAFAAGCEPLVHDGEVCLRALEAASCADYERYTGDVAREAPSECLFCPVEQP